MDRDEIEVYLWMFFNAFVSCYREEISGMVEHPLPVFWGRGTADTVIPPSAINRTQAWLPGHSTLTERIYEGMAHSISQQELGEVVTFLRAQYPPAA